MVKSRKAVRSTTSRKRQTPRTVRSGRRVLPATGSTPQTPLAPDGAVPPMVVAIGASAGGLEAFSQILDSLASEPGVALVFVQHLSPEHESALPALLASRTTLPVLQVTDGMAVEANRVHVMPPNVWMEVDGGRFVLRGRPASRSPFMPIDAFLQSLAWWAQDRTVGIILSGTGSDGALGIRDVKAMGGITIVQEPASAKHDGMPRAALATGAVDLVLTPKGIAEHIGHLRRHPYLQPDPVRASEPLPASQEQIQELFLVLRRECGIDFSQYKSPTVKRRLLRRMALHRSHDLGSYLRHLQEHPPEALALCQDLLIHVTRFFRDPAAFEALGVHVLSELAQGPSIEPIRIWVPGCATGEEAYSVAMVLAEALGERLTERKVQIFATDVSEAAIGRARSGAYPDAVSADIPPERLRRFLTKSDGGYRVSKLLRDLCVFARHDLTRDPPFSRLDLIVCRNVLIYLDAAQQKRLIALFHHALAPGGFLMLGSAETTTGAQASFAVVDKKWRLYQKTTGEPSLPRALPARQATPAHPYRFDRDAVHAPGRPERRSLQDEVNRLVLHRHGPPGVVVNADLEIVQFRGHTGAYLEAASGEPSLNVLKMVRGGLLHPLRSLLKTARRRRQAVRREDVLVQREDATWQAVNLEVLPLTTSHGDYCVVLFETPVVRPGKASRRPGPRTAGRTRAAADVRLSELRRELEASREYLQSIIEELETANEELQSANEEILSSNEELQSTNEELDTAKEELQSTNEELNTVNDELHSRNEELGRVNSDLVNLLASVDLPIIIVANDLTIRRYTPAAERLFNLRAGDMGRPITQINPDLECADLDRLLRDTIDGAVAQVREVRDREGRWYSLRIRPYKGLDNRLDGAVLTVIDVDAAKRYEQQVERSRAYFMQVVEMVRQPLLVLDPDLYVRTANRRFCEVFGLSRQRLEGTGIDALADGHWSGPELRALVADAAAGEAPRHASVEMTVPSMGTTRIEVTARRFEIEDSRPWIMLAMDMSDG
jgi:two-component system, chemotaxis family, CheB/CheR fusion protein